MARAAEMLGERWAMLIVRNLLVGPRRYTDLRTGLPGIPTNILSARLKELEEDGIVQRRVLPRPDGSVVYELTEYGRGLEPIVLALGRWGVQSLGEPQPGDVVTEDSMITAMRTTFRPEAAHGLEASYELRLGEVVIHMQIDDGRLEVAAGSLPDADLVIEAGPAIKALMAAEVSPEEAMEKGMVRVTGKPGLLSRFAEVFRI